MYPFQNILVVVDSADAEQPVLNRALDYALKHQAQLTLVDSVPEFGWAQKLVLSSESEHLPELLAREKSDRLKRLVAPIRRQGIKAKHRVLVGRSSLEITKQVLRNKHDLVMKAAKGRHSRQTGFLGTTARGLLRNCPCTVWLLKPDHHGPFRHALAAVDARPGDWDHEELNTRILQLAGNYCLDEAVELEVVSATGIAGSSYLDRYAVTDEFRGMLASIRAESQRSLNSLISHYRNIPPDHAHLLEGEASAEIPAYLKQHEVDLLVMGTVARRGIPGFLLGNTAEVILNKVECSVLAVKPAGFVSPVKSQSRKRNPVVLAV
jgi:nucleotide-binding universal stress UspA family protein